MATQKWAQAAAKSMRKRGTVGSLDRIAKRYGMSGIEFARKVMANPSKYPSSTVKKANFAVNINKGKK